MNYLKTRIRSYLLLTLSFFLLSQSLASCKKNNLVLSNNVQDSGIIKDNNIPGNYVEAILPDSQKVLNNPLTGWVLYGTADSPPDFWTKYDSMNIPGIDTPLKIENYAHTLYMRLSWSVLNPKEDEYGWDSNVALKNMIANAEKRGMRLAFRVVVDSRDKSTDFTPDYVRDDGAKGYETNTGKKVVWSPYPDDPIFQEKYDKFIKAFAIRFNNPDEVEFIDGYGLGKWGEGHSVLYLNNANRENVFKWIVNLYATNFTKVPLAINYHRMIGTSLEWGSPDPQSEALLDYAVEKGYILRHDAFGMTDYYQQWEKNYAAKWLYKRPIIMEGGWVTNQLDFTKDSRGYKTIADVRQGEFDDSRQAHVNMMDYRMGETSSWFTTQFALVQKFNSIGAYRLYPAKISLPKKIENGSNIKFTHEWENIGWGYCPDNILPWNQKYKVAFALLNERDSSVVKLFIDENANPANWIQGTPTNYLYNTEVNDITKGEYIWALGIVDATEDNKIGLQLGAKGVFTHTGWLTLFNVMVN